MRILQIAPIIERIPPKKYGGTERVINALTEELVKRGHDVTLFASGDSQTSAKLYSVYPKSLREAKINNLYGNNMWTAINTGIAYKKQHEFDVIHDHTVENSPMNLALAELCDTPVIATLHGPLTPHNKFLYQTFKKTNLVTISHAQYKNTKGINIVGTVYNGENMEHYPFSNQDDGYLLFVGRISMEKGVHHAIEVAQHLNLPLIIAAKLNAPSEFKEDYDYFKTYVEPYLSDQIRWIGEVEEEERNKLMSKALCVLHPGTWAEPFGLTIIESMSCGSPVVAFNKGSIPELIVNGKTGFVVNDLEEMIEAVSKINIIKRADCRNHAVKNFSATRMADGYETIYRQVIAESGVSYLHSYFRGIFNPQTSQVDQLDSTNAL